MAGGAEKIKLFKFIQKTYHDIGIDPHQSNENHNPINARNWLLLFSLAQFFLSTAAYLVFKANSAIEYVMVFYTCITTGLYLIIYLILFWQKKNILKYIENCERFIEKRTHSKILYRETNGKIERISEYFANFLQSSAVFIMLPPILYTIVSHYLMDSGEDAFLLFFPAWWPFDWKTPIGYFVAWLGQCAGVEAVLINIIPFLNIIFGSSWLFVVMAEDITNDTAAFNNTVETQNDCAKLVDRFCDILQRYSDAKQLINNFNEIYEYALFAYFSWAMLAISSLLVALQFQLWDDDSKPVEILILSTILLWIFGFNLLVCEPGQRVTDQYDEFGMEFGRCHWNKLPLEMQRMYLIFLSDTQQPKYIRSYGGIQCTRDTLKQITNKAFSYFMTLRRFRA